MSLHMVLPGGFSLLDKVIHLEKINGGQEHPRSGAGPGSMNHAIGL